MLPPKGADRVILRYMKQFFKGYVNYNCDQCGLWLDVYKNPFTVINSWESYYTPEWSSVQQGVTQAAARGIQNGIMAGLWANSGGDNPVLANSLSGGSPSYKSMLDWSYANGVGFTQFCVWCSQDSHVLSDYEHLGFPQIVANLQVEYPPTSSAQTSSLAQTSSRLPTALTLTPSTTTATVNQRVTFTASLRGSTTPLSSESVTIYHYLNGVRYNVVTKTTNASGKVTFTQKWTSPGKRLYYATFTGDTWYKASTSAALTITVN